MDTIVIKLKRPKIRRTWCISPVTRVKDRKRTSRNNEKIKIKKGGII